MSDITALTSRQIVKAAAWNRDNLDVSKVQVLPDTVMEDYPCLACFQDAAGSSGMFDAVKDAWLLAAFAQEVANVQDDAAGAAGAIDGQYGKKTISYLLSRYAENSGWIVGGGRNPASYLQDSPLNRVTFLDDPFFRLTKFSKRTKKARFVVLHWGGRSPRNLQNYFAGDDAQVSSHGAVGYENDGSVLATQTIDFDKSAWHGGWINQHSVGMDIAFSPQATRADYAKARGWPVEVIDNPTDRGERRIIDIPDELAEATAWLVHEWADVLGIRPEWVSRDPAALLTQEDVLASDGGFIMHSQFSARKWDCAPWGAKLMEWTDTVAGIREITGS